MNQYSWRFGVVSALSILLSAAAQPVIQKIAIGPARPDLLLVTMLCLAMLSNRTVGAIIGFTAGLVWGALTDHTIMEFCVSRTLVGFIAAWLPKWVIREYLITGILIVVGGTIISDVIYMTIHPVDLSILKWILKTILTAVYNGVVAIPVYGLLRWLIKPKPQS